MDTDFCLKTSALWRFIGYVIFVIKIIVPLVIIVLGVINLSKCVVSGKDDEIKTTLQNLFKKIIIGIIIFFIPTITKLVFSLISEASESMEYAEGCISCLTAPLSDVCKNAVGTAAEARKTQNEKLYNKFYEFVHKKKKSYVDYSDEKSGGNPEEKPDDPNNGSNGDHTPSPSLSSIPDGAVSATFTASDGVTYNYWLMIPKNRTNKMPLIVFLHGGGNDRDDAFNNLVTINNPAIDVIRYYGNNYPFIMLLPHNPGSWNVGGYDALNELIDKVVKQYNINTNKISLTGTSNGGNGLWRFVDKYPNVPSAIYIVSSGLNISESQAKNFMNIPIRGISDTEYGRYYSMKRNCDLINNYNGAGSCEVIERSDRTHDNILEIAYPKSVFEWMISQTK